MPETESQTIAAPILWAQRKNLVYLRIAVEDVKKPEIKVEKDKVYYKGNVGNTKKEYVADLSLFGEIKPDDSKWAVRDRGTEFVLVKSGDGFWKRLLKEDKKPHWLKVDFNKWKDEDDSDDEGAGPGGAAGGDFEEMMRQMGGLGGGGGGLPNMGDLDGEEEEGGDSDDEKLPDLE